MLCDAVILDQIKFKILPARQERRAPLKDFSHSLCVETHTLASRRAKTERETDCPSEFARRFRKIIIRLLFNNNSDLNPKHNRRVEAVFIRLNGNSLQDEASTGVSEGRWASPAQPAENLIKHQRKTH